MERNVVLNDTAEMNSYIEIYLHCVWATWDRHPLILPAFERNLWRELQREVVAQECRLLAAGGMEDHVHLLVQFRATLTVADFLQRVKGASSLWVNEQIRPDFHFKWQGAYGAFSVGREQVPTIRDYIKNQKRHHAENTLIAAYEKVNQPWSRVSGTVQPLD